MKVKKELRANSSVTIQQQRRTRKIIKKEITYKLTPLRKIPHRLPHFEGEIQQPCPPEKFTVKQFRKQTEHFLSHT